ncbi:MAG: hypothetical protein U1E93_05240 [Alphaproteobacteria bacterium]
MLKSEESKPRFRAIDYILDCSLIAVVCSIGFGDLRQEIVRFPAGASSALSHGLMRTETAFATMIDPIRR